MAKLTEEQAAEVRLRAEALTAELLKYLQDAKAQREVAFTALQTALAYVSVQMGLSFEDFMSFLAKNMPILYQKQFLLQKGEPAPVIDLSEARKEK